VNRRSDILALGSFVVLGLPDGMLGTAWPSMRATFGVPVGALGLVLLLGTAGSVLVTVFVGTLIQRLGVPALLTVAGLCAAVGVTGYALAPGFGLVLGVSVLSGASAGMMDAGLNTAIALTGRQRLLNLLHGAYGVGTAIGPLVVTAAILTGSWRPAYLTLTVLDLVIAGSWLRQRRRDGPVSRAAKHPQAIEPQSGPQWSRRRYGAVLAVGMSVFFLYTGLEVGAGQWEASFCRGHLNLSTGATGLATFGYWGALTAVRISLALVPRPVPPRTVVRFGTALAVIAAAAIWWQPGPAGTVIAFAALGGALAGVFPALITLTPGRIGERRAQHVIAWQVGAAAAGGAGVSALIGLLIGATSLAVLGPALTTLAVLVVASELILARLAPAPDPDPGRSPGPGPGHPARRPSAALHRVTGRLGHVLSPRRRGPPDVSARQLLGVPPRVLLHPVVGPALRPAITQTGSTIGLIRNVMLEITSDRWPPAARPGTRRVPDLG
jgi:fucose permease